MKLPTEVIADHHKRQAQLEVDPELMPSYDQYEVAQLVEYCEFAHAKLAELHSVATAQQLKLAMVAKVIV